ncbi:hypothetical protein B0H13DRAFT_1874535 [Mycena leptocephala]|nr:hypothetical protein B0H13DRAFT_1874535 [Mycena leptocephala]
MSSTAPRSDGKPSRYSGINPFKAPIPPGAVCLSQPLATHGQAIKARRSTGQRARRQRELAAEITALNMPGGVERGSARSRAQHLRRKLEAARKYLEDDPCCDSTNALSKAISRHESSNPFRRRRDLPSYQEQMFGRDEYLRMRSIVKEIDRENRERQKNSIQ